MGRRKVAASPLLASAFAVLLASCGVAVDGAPQVAGELVYGQPVSAFVRGELAVAQAARDIEPCGLLDAELVASFGELTAYGPVGDLSTCHAELVPFHGRAADPAWVEVTVGEREPSEQTGARETMSGLEVRPAVGSVPGTCTLYFRLPAVATQAAVAGRWGHVSYLDGAGRLGDSPAGDDCAEARTVAGSVAGKLHSPESMGPGIPLAQQDPCAVVEKLSDRGVEVFLPGARPYECHITLRGGDRASVRLALSPERPRAGGPELVELDGKEFAHFRDSFDCHYYFYPGGVLDTEAPSSPPSEHGRPGNRLTASVAASAPSCDDAQTLVLESFEMFDY
ncbi:hypothetical protein BFN03_16385 [Rhodococcus sp. WMMA185]|uniref:hypothetical protein n=1 Tax=Rhodococcus sp. WMMA185 TaxID=679318 RepID=UPI000878A04D|nr:hypothetical protein [Rhodococcus sp. WMMA185]AOW93694.1 hypothetical protein BFN03_16385 [Rhodococcus sp. WMMA185]